MNTICASCFPSSDGMVHIDYEKFFMVLPDEVEESAKMDGG